jgi:hypothetical protein
MPSQNSSTKKLHNLILMKNEVMHMSLSDLVKKSAMQICYLRKNQEKQPEPTEQQIAGAEAGLAKAMSKLVEMRGTYSVPNNFGQTILIHYAFDEIVPNDKACLFLERKNIPSGQTIELWYRNAAILQTAVYQAFAKQNTNRELETAQFFINQGNPKLEFDLGNLYLRSELHLGDIIYSVIAVDPRELVDFYIKKAIATLNYESAKQWDWKYKHKEFDYNHTNITYRLLHASETIEIK